MHRPSRFYITAESKGSCCALWCSVPGAGNRRVVFLGERSSPSVRSTAAGTPPTATAGVPAAVTGQAGVMTKRETGDGESLGSCAQLGDEKGCSKMEDRHARRIKAQAETAKAAAAAAAVATKRAAALSAALIDNDDEAASASRSSRKPLFTSGSGSTGGLREEGLEVGYGTENENASGGGRDGEEPVNIVVVSRCRPLLVREMKRGVRAAVFCDGNEIVVSGESLPNRRPRRFSFDRVFGKFRNVKPQR